ncbi:hypothetical protein ACFYO0_15805 [Streptomyces sp. NPDC006365]|uniref:hypothetical protein n=1 Tax=Streptomyces sp. NPDC006365 TaxID=3364744 RepID=UPI0036913DBD
MSSSTPRLTLCFTKPQVDAPLARLRDPAPADFTRSARALGDITVHRRTHNVRRRYDRAPHWPGGLLAVGDALCAFNPVYGQGITVAAPRALLLRQTPAAGTRPGWERRLMRRPSTCCAGHTR